MDGIESIADIREKLVEPSDVETVVETPVEQPKEAEKVEEPAKEEVITEQPKEALPEATDEVVVEAAKFIPEFKFKAGGKEYEVPEKFRSLVTDEASQKEIKEIFEKAYGLDDLKPRHLKQKETLEKFETEFLPRVQEQNQIIDELAGYLKQKDFDSYFEKLQVDEKDVQKWMLQKLSLTPEQNQLYNEKRELQKQLMQQKTENQTLNTTVDAATREYQKQLESQALNALQFTLDKSEYKNAVQSHDATHGKGSFQNKVIQYADYIHKTSGKILGIEEAVKEYTAFIPPVTAASTQNNSVGIAAQKSKPVLPQVAAKPYSPAAKQITSIAQLRDKANEMSASQD